MAANMKRMVSIEVDLGLKGVEKVDVHVYLDGVLVQSHWDRSYDDLPAIARNLRSKYPDADVEACGSGLDCACRPHRWKLEL